MDHSIVTSVHWWSEADNRWAHHWSMLATPPPPLRGPLSGAPMPAAHSASVWLCGRAPISSFTRLQQAGGRRVRQRDAGMQWLVHACKTSY